MDAISLAAACALAAAYALGHRLERGLLRLAKRRWLSFAAGVSTAYVFVDVFPELDRHAQTLVDIVGEHSLFGDRRLHVLALAAFVFFYGMDHLVRHSDAADATPSGNRLTDVMGLAHVVGFCVYAFLIGSLLPERAAIGTRALAFYTVAMALHFTIVDHLLDERRGTSYRRWGRWIIAAAIPAGCLVAAISPLSETVLARIDAVIAGGMVVTSAQAELPREREGRFGWFLAGAILFAALLTAR